MRTIEPKRPEVLKAIENLVTAVMKNGDGFENVVREKNLDNAALMYVVCACWARDLRRRQKGSSAISLALIIRTTVGCWPRRGLVRWFRALFRRCQ